MANNKSAVLNHIANSYIGNALQLSPERQQFQAAPGVQQQVDSFTSGLANIPNQAREYLLGLFSNNAPQQPTELPYGATNAQILQDARRRMAIAVQRQNAQKGYIHK